MKDLYIRLNANIKMLLGMCNSKHCYKKSIAEIYIPKIDTKRCLCEDHLVEFQRMNLICSTKRRD